MIKKLLSIGLAAAMLLSLCACGEDKSSKKDKNKANATDGFVVMGQDYDGSLEIGTPDNKLDPQEIYDNLEYTSEFFYGNYQLFGGDDAEKEYAKNSNYMDYTQNGKELKLTTVPFALNAGKHTFAHKINYVTDYDWMRVYFYQRTDTDDYLYTVICAYSVENNKLILKPLSTFNVDDDNNKITYEFSDTVWEYEFEFSGRELTLSNGKDSVTMSSGLDPYAKYDYIHADAYVSPESKTIDKIDHINFRYDGEEPDEARFNIEFYNYKTPEGSYGCVGKFEENGLFTFTVPWETGTKTYQYVYFLCGNDGVIFADNDDIYFYNDDYSDRNRNDINTYLSEDQTGKLNELTEQELEAIVEKKEDLLEDLVKAFDEAGIKVTVNNETGELIMDSSILFGGDSAVLTDEGKKFLNKFVGAYTKIVFSEKYDGFISKTMVEGHTAPVSGSTYESGLPLSKERAEVVKNYCVSSETGVDTTKLAAALEAIGYSNSKPITKDGKVDMAASRRVSFKFIINLDK